MKRAKKLLLWTLGSALFLGIFSLMLAFGVKYVTNERIISDAAEALALSFEARKAEEAVSRDWGPYEVWGEYEQMMWQQIAMLYEIENSPLTLRRQRRVARKMQDRLVSYFRAHGSDYVSYIEDVFGGRTFRELFDEKMDEALEESDVEDILRQMRPYADEMIAELEALFESWHGIKRRALIIYHMRMVEDREDN